MKKLSVLLLSLTAMVAACTGESANPPTTSEPDAPFGTVVPVETAPTEAPAPEAPPSAPELKFDANGDVIMPDIKAPAPPKPEGGPQAPELTPEMLEQAKAFLAEQEAAEPSTP